MAEKRGPPINQDKFWDLGRGVQMLDGRLQCTLGWKEENSDELILQTPTVCCYLG